MSSDAGIASDPGRRSVGSVMHRRRFARLLGGAVLAPFWACRQSEPDRDAVGRLLGLQPAERAWLDPLTPTQLQDLRAALEKPGGQATDRAVQLAFTLVGSRSRTFAFVGYPQVSDRRSVCDGLLAE
jgi:hypothetical protein